MYIWTIDLSNRWTWKDTNSDIVVEYVSSNIEYITSSINLLLSDVDMLLQTWSRVTWTEKKFSDYDFELILNKEPDISEIWWLVNIWKEIPLILYFYLVSQKTLLSELNSDIESAKWYYKCIVNSKVLIWSDNRNEYLNACNASFNSNNIEFIDINIRKILEYLSKLNNAIYSNDEKYVIYCINKLILSIENILIAYNKYFLFWSESTYYDDILLIKWLPDDIKQYYENIIWVWNINLKEKLMSLKYIIKYLFDILKNDKKFNLDVINDKSISILLNKLLSYEL